MKPLLLVALFAAIVNFLHAQPTAPKTPGTNESTLTSEQTDSIVKQLDALEALMGKNRNDLMSGALARCTKAISAGESGALQLYFDCYKLEHFDRANSKASDFQDWAKKNIEKHKDPDFLIAVWLQLDYLILSIQAQDAKEKDIPTLVTSLQTFMSRLITAMQNSSKQAGGATNSKGNRGQNFDSGKLQQMLHQSVKNSEFAKAFQIEAYLKKDDWTYDPIDIRGIYEKVIFPYYLEKKPAELPTQWDTRIKSELAIKAATMSESDYSAFLKEHYSDIVWHKSEYLVSNNINTVQCLADMLKILRENPAHPEAASRTKRLRDLVISAQPPGGPSASEPPAKSN